MDQRRKYERPASRQQNHERPASRHGSLTGQPLEMALRSMSIPVDEIPEFRYEPGDDLNTLPKF